MRTDLMLALMIVLLGVYMLFIGAGLTCDNARIDALETTLQGASVTYDPTPIVCEIELPADFDLEYRWTLPPLNTILMNVEEKYRLLIDKEVEIAFLEGMLKPYQYTPDWAVEGNSVLLGIWYKTPDIVINDATLPDDCKVAVSPIIQSYVAARRAQVDALRKEIK